MKKAFHLILCSALVFAVSNPAKASPTVIDDHKTTLADVVSQMEVTPMVFKLEASYVFEQKNMENVLTALPVSTVQVPEVPTKENPLALDGRIRMHRHYFNHEDNKEYPEYQADKLSDGFTNPVDKPARK